MKLSLLVTSTFLTLTMVTTTNLASTEISNSTLMNHSASKAHPVGSCYGGGVVFYVNKEPNAPAGRKGLIVALSDVSNQTLQWDSSGNTEVEGISSAYFSGLRNTSAILSTINNAPNPGGKSWPAAQAAAEYIAIDDGKTDPCPTCTTWYLPSQDELATVYYQSKNFENFWNNAQCAGTAPSANDIYWSSTQYKSSRGYDSVWYVGFDNGRIYIFPSWTSMAKVRSIRAF